MTGPLQTSNEGVELRHLRAFVAVAEELNFGRAAQRLFLTQPALSRQIRGLEKAIGCDLFLRNTRSVALTAAGSALLDKARAVLAEVDAALTAARVAGGEVEARMGWLWNPVVDTFDGDLTTMRAAFEFMHAQFPMAEDVLLAPVNTDGVPGIRLTPAEHDDTVVLFVHGGGFTLGSAYGYRAMGAALARTASTQVIVPEYRLAPEHRFPAARDDVLTAYRWLLDTGPAPERIALAGDSTGAMLILNVLTRARDLGLPMPRAALLMCPATAFYAPLDQSPADIEQHTRYQTGYLGERPLDDAEANPLIADFTGLPPTLVQSAKADEFGRRTEDLVQRMRAAGVSVRHESYGPHGHCFQLFWSFNPASAEALGHAAEFLQVGAAAYRV